MSDDTTPTKLFTFSEPFPILPRFEGHVRIQAAIARDFTYRGYGNPKRPVTELALDAVMLMNNEWYDVTEIDSRFINVHDDHIVSTAFHEYAATKYPPLSGSLR